MKISPLVLALLLSAFLLRVCIQQAPKNIDTICMGLLGVMCACVLLIADPQAIKQAVKIIQMFLWR